MQEVLVRIFLFPEAVAQGGSHGYIQIDWRCHWGGGLVVAVGIVEFNGGVSVSVRTQEYRGRQK